MNINNEQSENIREKFVFIPFKNHYKILNAVKSKPNATYEELKKETSFSNGLVYNSIKDIKIMKLISNGYGLRLTQLGEQWLNESNKAGKVNNDILKEACLNVPLFREIYEKIPNLINHQELINSFSSFIADEVYKKHMGAIVKRYLEGIHNIVIRQGSKIIKVRNIIPHLRNQKDMDNETKIIEVLEIIKEIKKKPLEDSIQKYGKIIVKNIIEHL